MQAFCDFDGTISIKDVTDLVLERFALPEWQALEDEWAAGRIPASECMRGQVSLIRADRHDLDVFLDNVDIDPYFIKFVHFCHENGIRLTVVSDGIDYFIQRVLVRHGVSDVEIIANRLVLGKIGDETSFSLKQPFINGKCSAGSGVCKCAVVSNAGPHFYVGDSRSDFCVAHDAMHVFAKYKLVDYCEAKGIAYVQYQDFSDVMRNVASLVKHPAPSRFSLPAAISV